MKKNVTICDGCTEVVDDYRTYTRDYVVMAVPRKPFMGMDLCDRCSEIVHRLAVEGFIIMSPTKEPPT